MVYYIDEIPILAEDDRTANVKARDDITQILRNAGFSGIKISYDVQRKGNRSFLVQLKEHRAIYRDWKTKTRNLKGGDTLIVQFPPFTHSLFLHREFHRLKLRGVRQIAILHDVELLRGVRRKTKSLKTRMRKYIEESMCLKCFTRLIVHNGIMQEKIGKLLHLSEEKMIPLGIFDYLVPGSDSKEAVGRNEGIVIAGNLLREKAGYVYHLPEGIKWNLFGVNYTGSAAGESAAGSTSETGGESAAGSTSETGSKSAAAGASETGRTTNAEGTSSAGRAGDPENKAGAGVTYYGSLPPSEIAAGLRGSFGLVWDGSETKECAGVYGEYLMYNNPHKTSLYLAAGLPVIIWKKAALASFIRTEGAGFAVDSLGEIRSRLDSLTESEYIKMQDNARRIGKNLKSGFYTKRALTAAGVHFQRGSI